MEVMFWIWLAVIVVSVIIEVLTLDLVAVWFSVGAVVPFILSAIGGVPLEIELIIFVVPSALLIIFVRKYAQKLLFKNMNTKTNVHAQEGKRYRLLEDADFEKNGSIKINDVVWTAVSENGEKISRGQLVEITKIDGNKMVVKRVEEKPQPQNKEEIKEEEK
ncbi:MAG: NfeD family protein [Clostridia bacterium]|nr:NfeD family protein [Clostridia bacterium]